MYGEYGWDGWRRGRGTEGRLRLGRYVMICDNFILYFAHFTFESE
jgi:hypothetical protein